MHVYDGGAVLDIPPLAEVGIRIRLDDKRRRLGIRDPPGTPDQQQALEVPIARVVRGGVLLMLLLLRVGSSPAAGTAESRGRLVGKKES